jgi:hypothetical protein
MQMFVPGLRDINHVGETDLPRQGNVSCGGFCGIALIDTCFQALLSLSHP